MNENEKLKKEVKTLKINMKGYIVNPAKHFPIMRTAAPPTSADIFSSQFQQPIESWSSFQQRFEQNRTDEIVDNIFEEYSNFIENNS